MGNWCGGNTKDGTSKDLDLDYELYTEEEPALKQYTQQMLLGECFSSFLDPHGIFCVFFLR